MVIGRIIKGIGGFYYVMTELGLIECKARGKFRLGDQSPLPGDMVDVQIDDNNIGYLMNMHDRKNELIRPPVVNIDQLIVVITPCSPMPDLLLVDKILAIAEFKGIDAKVCINKNDLSSVETIAEIYKKAGYDVYITSAEMGTGIDDVIGVLKDKITAFAGSSGVGKSSIINIINDNYAMETGAMSAKNLRGKHTTRHVELLPLTIGGYIVDTPGFSRFEVSGIRASELADNFREFEPLILSCKYTGCSHTKEAGCSIIEAVKDKSIPGTRYENYIVLYDELKKIKDWMK